MPRSGSICQASSLFFLTRPGSLPPALLTLVLTIRNASELQIYDARQADSCLFGYRHFQISVALLAFRHFDAGRNLFPVDCSAQPAQVLQKKLPALRIAPQTKVFARN